MVVFKFTLCVFNIFLIGMFILTKHQKPNLLLDILTCLNAERVFHTLAFTDFITFFLITPIFLVLGSVRYTHKMMIPLDF